MTRVRDAPLAGRVRLLLLVAVTVVALTATGVLLRPSEGSGVATSAPTTSAPTTSPAPPASSSPAEGPVQVAAPTRVEVPSVDLAVDVLPVTPTDGEINPPTLEEAYWIEAYGAPGSEADNTVYLAGHSFDQGPAAFNPLFDKEAQVALVQPGAEVVVTTSAGMLTYVVSSTERYRKNGLAEEDEVWRIVPGRLVLITCFQRNDGAASRDNLVVYADLVSSVPTAG